MIFKRSHSPTRRSRRQWINTSVQVFTGFAQLNALGINLSDGGMGLFAIANLPVGSQVQIEFVPPKTKTPVRMPAMIRHRALYLYGVEFLPDETNQEQEESSMAQQA
jgi:PilZ domain